MNKSAFHILRVGLAITFLWIGILIIKQPEAWGGYLRPWVVNLLPVSLKEALLGTAMLDIAIGALLLVDKLTFAAAAAAGLHLAVVLTTSGITDITVRDIGLLAVAIAIMIERLPRSKQENVLERKSHE